MSTSATQVAPADVGQEHPSAARSRFSLPVALVALGLIATVAWISAIVGAIVWLIIS
jgi:hypothetical protein